MLIRYQINENDFIRANALMLSRKTPYLRLFPWIGACILLSAFGPWLIKGRVGITSLVDSSSIPQLTFGLIVPVFFIAIPWLTKAQIRRQFRQNTALAQARTLQSDFSGLHFRSESASSDLAWNLFIGFAEDRFNFLLIQQGNTLFVPIPKRELTPAEIEESRSLFEFHLPKK